MPFSLLGELSCSALGCEIKIQTTAEVDLNNVPSYYETEAYTEIKIVPHVPDDWSTDQYGRHFCPECGKEIKK